MGTEKKKIVASIQLMSGWEVAHPPPDLVGDTKFSLRIVQEPICGTETLKTEYLKAPRPIEPPIIIRVMAEGVSPAQIAHIPTLFIMARAKEAGVSDSEVGNDYASRTPSVSLEGACAQNIMFLEACKPPCAFAAFSNLAIQQAGNYELNFTLYYRKIGGGIQRLASARSRSFPVNEAKSFPGYLEQTGLTRAIIAAGAKVPALPGLRRKPFPNPTSRFFSTSAPTTSVQSDPATHRAPSPPNSPSQGLEQPKRPSQLDHRDPKPHIKLAPPSSWYLGEQSFDEARQRSFDPTKTGPPARVDSRVIPPPPLQTMSRYTQDLYVPSRSLPSLAELELRRYSTSSSPPSPPFTFPASPTRAARPGGALARREEHAPSEANIRRRRLLEDGFGRSYSQPTMPVRPSLPPIASFLVVPPVPTFMSEDSRRSLPSDTHVREIKRMKVSGGGGWGRSAIWEEGRRSSIGSMMSTSSSEGSLRLAPMVVDWELNGSNRRPIHCSSERTTNFDTLGGAEMEMRPGRGSVGGGGLDGLMRQWDKLACPSL
ncbi:hypothetical protein T439DRAFT_352917 [Meredithblackwellia eburnea MCA 4105]